MNEQMIGEVAGEVWRYLDRNGGRADLSSIRNNVRAKEGVSADLGTGWLAREGKLHFSLEHGTVQVVIRR
jgi:hypothetical protein